MSHNSLPGNALIEHHRQLAAGGIGMTTLSYCSVSRDGLAFDNEIYMREEIIPDLRRLTEAIHHEGAAVSVQLGHCGFFANKSVIGKRPLGASRKFCLFRNSICRTMDEYDIERVRNDFGRAARIAVESGFDAVEIHAGHGYLLSQFLSPWTNKRKDYYGGSLENRLRFPVSVINQVRKVVGSGYPILVKMNCDDGFNGGLDIDEAIEVAKHFEISGADVVIPSCGFTARTSFHMMRGKVPILQYAKSEKNLIRRSGMAMFGRFVVREVPYADLFLLEKAKRIKDAVKIPVAYIGGVCSMADMEKVMAEGFEFVQVGRATIKDPEMVKKMQAGEVLKVDCDHCNRCVAAMATSGVRCWSND